MSSRKENVKDLVTILITTFNNNDFTRASLWSVRMFFPETRIMLLDGGSKEENLPELKNLAKKFNTELMIFYDAPTESCKNAAVGVIETPFVLFMDNDTKILSKDAVTMCLDVLEKDSNIAQTGGYAIKTVDREKRISYVGTEFTESMPVTSFSQYFSMHRLESYKLVDGMRIREFFYDVPEKVWKNERQPGWTGDFNIGNYYAEKGLVSMTPPRKVPLVHWGRACFESYDGSRITEWWGKNCTHIRCNPLNDWEKMEEERVK